MTHVIGGQVNQSTGVRKCSSTPIGLDVLGPQLQGHCPEASEKAISRICPMLFGMAYNFHWILKIQDQSRRCIMKPRGVSLTRPTDLCSERSSGATQPFLLQC